jgi:hypothetical protein
LGDGVWKARGQNYNGRGKRKYLVGLTNLIMAMH